MKQPLPARKRASIGHKPAADPASTWVRQADAPEVLPKALVYTARLTIDVTPALRARIKLGAIRRGVTTAEMLRDLLEAEFAESAP